MSDRDREKSRDKEKEIMDGVKKRRGNLRKKPKNKIGGEGEDNKKECNHDLEYFKKKSLNDIKHKNFYKFCHTCNGLFIYHEDKDILKTVSYLDKEITINYFDPFLIFQETKKTYKKENLSYLNTFIKFRKDMINFVSKLKNKYKASSDVFFLTIRLIDIVCSKIVKFDIDLELISIACFFLASKIFFLKKFKKFDKIYNK